MSLDIYSKEPLIINENKFKQKDKYFFALISLLGFIGIVFAAWPIFVWQVSTLPRLTSIIDNVPVPQSKVLSVSSYKSGDIQVIQDADGFSYFTTDHKVEGDRPEKFSISIPKLDIKNANTKVDNLDFRKNLSHFPGTALPGEVGNSFITGHSVLPQFNDPDNFNAIFTKLSDLEIGDKINVTADGKQYQYIVQYSKVVDPTDLSVLNPISKNGKNLTLMTCVPPGTNIKRLVVITSLI